MPGKLKPRSITNVKGMKYTFSVNKRLDNI